LKETAARRTTSSSSPKQLELVAPSGSIRIGKRGGFAVEDLDGALYLGGHRKCHGVEGCSDGARVSASSEVGIRLAALEGT